MLYLLCLNKHQKDPFFLFCKARPYGKTLDLVAKTSAVLRTLPGHEFPPEQAISCFSHGGCQWEPGVCLHLIWPSFLGSSSRARLREIAVEHLRNKWLFGSTSNMTKPFQTPSAYYIRDCNFDTLLFLIWWFGILYSIVTPRIALRQRISNALIFL